MTPVPGKPVRGSKTGRPVMALLDLLGRRTCMRILWELRDAPLKFRPLQAAADTSPGVLNTRLGELKTARLVELSDNGYQLTADGLQLISRLLPLMQWAEHWSEGFQPSVNSDD